jgi:HTH-type transcriptional regulator/antitoxin HigA
MTYKAATRSRPHVGARYLALIDRFALRPIRSDAELDRAIKVINELLDRGKLTVDEDDYLDVLSDLVKRYETEQHPIEPASAADMLRFLIESHEVTLSKVAEETGVAVSTISAILAGKRTLNRRHIEAFARHFHVEPSVFMST